MTLKHMNLTPPGACASDLDARSTFVSVVFDRLNAMQIEYCVMNNYSDLPRTIPSDIDIAIHPDAFRNLDAFVRKVACDHKVEIVQKLWHGNYKCAYILSDVDAVAPFFVQLDFFTDFSTSWCPRLMSFEDLAHGRRKFRNFYIPQPDSELVFIAMRRIFKNDWSSRHCTRIAELRRTDGYADSLALRYAWLEEIINLAALGRVDELSARRQRDWRRMRRFAWTGLSAIQVASVVYWQSLRIFYRLRHETGNATVLIGEVAMDHLTEGTIERALDQVFYRTMRVKWEGPTGISRFFQTVRLAAEIKFAKLRKTLVLVAMDPSRSQDLQLIQLLLRLSIVDGSVGRESVATPSRSSAVRLILRSQAEKTRIAMGRSSQTSGGNRV